MKTGFYIKYQLVPKNANKKHSIESEVYAGKNKADVSRIVSDTQKFLDDTDDPREMKVISVFQVEELKNFPINR